MEHLGYELTSELSKEAFDRDKAEMLEAFNPRYVTIDQERTPAGCLGLFKVTVHVKSYILTCEEDNSPKPVDKLVFYVKVFDNYPAIAPKLYFAPNCRLAHVNTYRNGTQCIDKWGKYSSLKNAVEKTIRAIIYDENVTKYNSKACGSIEDWQKGMAAKKVFPMLNPPDLILRESNAVEMPSVTTQLPPPLPGRLPTTEPKRTPLPPPLPARR